MWVSSDHRTLAHLALLQRWWHLALLYLCEEWLLGGESRGQLEVIEEDMLDCPDADITEPRNPLLQPKQSQEGVDVEQILHPLYHSPVDLPASSAGARIGLELGWPG